MIIQMWHTALDMPKHDKAWHTQDIADELAELQEAPTALYAWSELSDVAYTYSRGRWSGHNLDLPISRPKYMLGVVYMYPKYTARYIFFRNAGKKAGSIAKLREVRNPKKTHKLHAIAEQYGLDKDLFQKVCEKQLTYYILLP